VLECVWVHTASLADAAAAAVGVSLSFAVHRAVERPLSPMAPRTGQQQMAAAAMQAAAAAAAVAAVSGRQQQQQQQQALQQLFVNGRSSSAPDHLDQKGTKMGLEQ